MSDRAGFSEGYLQDCYHEAAHAVFYRRAGLAVHGIFAAATLALAAIGVLEGAGALPWVVPGEESTFIEFYDSLPAWAQVAFGTWQATGTLLGLVLPAAAVAAWGRRGEGGGPYAGCWRPTLWCSSGRSSSRPPSPAPSSRT